MVSSIQRVRADRLQSRKDRQTASVATLTTLLGELETDAKSAGVVDISDDYVVAKCKKFIKSLEETSSLISDDATRSLIASEIALLSTYIPSQMDSDTITHHIRGSGATNMGEAMKYMKATFSGQYDGVLASSLAKQMFN
jgi:hypothetical protein